MTRRGGAFVVLAFACVWLWVGASAQPMPWRAVAGAVGVAVLAGVAWRVWHRPPPSARFDRRRFRITVALEIAAATLAGWLLGRAGLIGDVWPVTGVIVGLHFIGLWWATGERRYVALTIAMTAVNLIALAFPPGSAAMLGISGFGSSAALAAAIAA